jgi:hypothetical protein
MKVAMEELNTAAAQARVEQENQLQELQQQREQNKTLLLQNQEYHTSCQAAKAEVGSWTHSFKRNMQGLAQHHPTVYKRRWAHNLLAPQQLVLFATVRFQMPLPKSNLKQGAGRSQARRREAYRPPGLLHCNAFCNAD